MEAVRSSSSGRIPRPNLSIRDNILFDGCREDSSCTTFMDAHGCAWRPGMRSRPMAEMFVSFSKNVTTSARRSSEVGTTWLHHYVDFGLTFVKLGRRPVDLERFNMDGARLEIPPGDSTTRKMAAYFECCRLRMCSVMNQLRAVSDNWLEKRQEAKRFPGFFCGLLRFCGGDQTRRTNTGLCHDMGNSRKRNCRSISWGSAGRTQRHYGSALRHIIRGEGRKAITGSHSEWHDVGFEQSPVAPLWTRAASFFTNTASRSTTSS
jgi:hypothetical protein